jgi:hypothetical protein
VKDISILGLLKIPSMQEIMRIIKKMDLDIYIGIMVLYMKDILIIMNMKDLGK